MLKKDENYCILQIGKTCKKKGGIKKETEFYMATSELFNGKKIHICKECIHDYAYGNGNSPDVDRFKELLRASDYPFYKDVWDSSFNDLKMETVGAYFKNIWLNYKQKTWKDSDSLCESNIKAIEEQELLSKDYNDSKLSNIWGRGYTIDELHWLEDYYESWRNKFGLEDLPVQRLARRISITELKIRKAEENGDNTDKLDKSLMELMDKASLTPKNLKGTAETDSQKAWGLFIRDIEKTKPAEFYKNKKLYEDHDGLLDYFKRFILRPMRNLLTGTRIFDKEYNIEKEPQIGDVDYGIDENGNYEDFDENQTFEGDNQDE